MSTHKAIFDTVRPWLDDIGFNDPKRIAALNGAIEQVLKAAEKPALALPAGLSAPDVPHFAIIAAHLEREEGRISSAYKDHLGYWTIGVGRLIDKRKGGRLTDAEIDTLLANDIREKAAQLAKHPGTKAAWAAVKDDPYRATAILSMAFQMGVEGLAKFTGSMPLIAAKQWRAAAANMLKSLWAKQTPERAKRVTHMIATGEPA